MLVYQRVDLIVRSSPIPSFTFAQVVFSRYFSALTGSEKAALSLPQEARLRFLDFGAGLTF